MKIYTKSGDAGTTSLIGGTRVSKDDIRVETYGTIDELNSWIGLLGSMETIAQHQTLLTHIQQNLFTVGGQFAAENKEIQQRLPKISAADVSDLETQIDSITAQLPQLKKFVIPGGSIASSYASVARTVCRRAERCAVRNHSEDEHHLELSYLNRLSDFLFVFSRLLNIEEGIPERILE